MAKAKKVLFFVGMVWGSVIALRFITSKISALPAVLKV